MDQRDRPMSFEERQMEQLLSSLQRLLLSTPQESGAPGTPGTPGTPRVPVELWESSDEQDPANNSPASEFDVIDPEVAAAELNHVLAQLSWRQNLLEEENCPFIWNYFNVAIQIMADLHKEHSPRPVETRRKLNRPHPRTRSTRTQQSPSSPDTRAPSLDYLFKCSTCCDMITTLYERFNPDLCSFSNELQEVLAELPNPFLNEASSSQLWQTSIDTERSRYIDESRYNIQPQRPSSPVPNLPSTSRQYYFSEQPSPSEDMGSTSPVPNLPSTSRNINFSDAGQPSANSPSEMRPVHNPQRSTESPIDAERKKRILRLKKERSLYKQHKRRK
ncbi:unnamed protein product [Arctia plantaginis]|uniref:Uncharacterized protein n=1 Tax=Arctia plantaginis TaxID=874455 RepID=A0A8S0Z0K3_ARCPL|nr:unnamed protein product [Arctia plantaginis]